MPRIIMSKIKVTFSPCKDCCFFPVTEIGKRGHLRDFHICSKREGLNVQTVNVNGVPMGCAQTLGGQCLQKGATQCSQHLPGPCQGACPPFLAYLSWHILSHSFHLKSYLKCFLCGTSPSSALVFSRDVDVLISSTTISCPRDWI